ncbi:hypothetical protein GQ43DRAFT_453988 [Delitschia confertaspora ATCC 74209]|uniref:RING-type E3 ubiquitin transferase n=1 Tax=Delitschia confertaspora ATCC 74209 TaxID=1513339 RepID=A0A9P4JVC6_9PLEO|nr:hypothetical protein GQ43DRAFT_453988 [Delitschia confertaspora ATCC 74209]
MTRTQIYVGVSALLANLVLLRAYYERPNFYSAAVYISQSNGSLMLLVNLALILGISFGCGLQRLLYGPLRPIEIEQLYDKAWFAVSETLLAMTIFRDDVGVWFFTMFLGLLGGKVWQWIGEGRVEFLEQQPPANPRLFHARLSSSLLLSVLFDAFMVRYCVDTVLGEARPGMMVMFGFEYALLFIVSMSTLCRYALSVVELFIVHRQTQARAEAQRIARIAREQTPQQPTEEGAPAPAPEEAEDDDDIPGWEEKGRWVFYLDLVTDFIKSVVYMGFFMILVAFHGIPIHIIRDLFMTIRSFVKRLNDFVQYRNATRDMNARYPDATEEDLRRDNTCIVCREEMRPWTQPGADAAGAPRRVDERQRPKQLPCGHILHFSCLRSWLERQQVCPTCRRPVLVETTPQNNQQNNQANAGQGPQNIQARQRLFQFLNQQAQGNQQPAQGAQGGQQPPQAQQGAPPNRPAGNMRIFNLGPIRIALGNIRIPANNPVQNNPVQNNNNAGMEEVVQRILQHQIQPQPAQPNGTPQYTLPPPPATGISSGTPAAIQADILRIQDNIIQSMRQLNTQHAQLEYIQMLLGELHRLQQATGATTNTQEPPQVASANLQWPARGIQQAYFPPEGSAVIGPGDPNLPAGLTLPEGWTIRRLVPMVQEAQSSDTPVRPPTPGPAASSLASVPQPLSTLSSLQRMSPSSGTTQLPPASTPASAPSQTTNASATAASAIRDTPPSSPETSAPKATEPVSSESSWSFGSVGGLGEGEASGSSARPSSEGAARRTVTVEEVEDVE